METTTDETNIRRAAEAARNKLLTSQTIPPRCDLELDNVPSEMKLERRWVCWKWHRNKDKWTKKPVKPSQPEVGASSTDPSAWSDFGAAVAAYKQHADVAGIGFVLGDGYAGVDLDCCIADSKVCYTAESLVSHTFSYAEISPTETGIKVLVKGNKPADWSNNDFVEIYDEGRYFTITGHRFGDCPSEVNECNFAFLDDQKPDDRFRHAINAMRKVPLDRSEKDGSARVMQYAGRAVYCGLDSVESLDAIKRVLVEHPAPRSWTDDEILQRISQAERRHEKESSAKASKLTLGKLFTTFPGRRPELIDGLLRRGEVMNIIAAPKEGKSWMVYGMALSVASGMNWLGHSTNQGNVLLIDNELHPSELAFRLSKAATSMFLDPADIGDALLVEPLRGTWPNIHAIDSMLAKNYEKADISLIVLDAYYRLLPGGTSENDNAAVTEIFNQLDKIAARHQCSIALVHHASKGDQSGKALTDIGSGAGALTRAADTHVVIRPHEEESCAVMEAVCRSHKQPKAKTIRFDFPTWHFEEGVQPDVKRPETGMERGQNKRNLEADSAVLGCLHELTEASVNQIRKHTGLSPDRITKAITRLLDSDRIQVTKETKIRGKDVKIYSYLGSLEGVL